MLMQRMSVSCLPFPADCVSTKMASLTFSGLDIKPFRITPMNDDYSLLPKHSEDTVK